MKPLSYLCFTLLSIGIQFCFMDFINEKVPSSGALPDQNKSFAKNFTDVFKTMKEKPHAVYYRNNKENVEDANSKQYNNLSFFFTNFRTSTEYVTTVFDLLYDENSTLAEDYSLPTERYYYTTSEFDNVTEIALFDKTSTTMKPSKKNQNKLKCPCDLLYQHCDIDCCCDNDCSERERGIFNNCKEIKYKKMECFIIQKLEYTYLHSFMPMCSSDLTNVFYKHLFCIDKVNLGGTRGGNKNKLTLDVHEFMKWHSSEQEMGPIYNFNKTEYQSGQPVWFLDNGTLNIIQLPATVSNQYCSGQKIMKFLQNEHIKCFVKIKDLHMLHVLRFLRTNVVSSIPSTSNSTVLNCTTLHCVNWTLSVCNESACGEYNETQHLPTCFNSHCNNIATKVEYSLSCNGSIITKAVIKLYVKRITTIYQYYSQEIIINYYMGNGTVDEIVKYSGNPGYLKGFPVITSFVERNHTEHFYNGTHSKKTFLLFPYNENGECSKTNFTFNILKFGENKRIKCRLTLGQQYVKQNKTDGCIKIQERIIEYLGLNDTIFISPLGNPNELEDDEWILLRKFNKSDVYGQYRPNDSKFVCNNIMTRFIFVMAFADVTDNSIERNKILSASVEGMAQRVLLSADSPAALLTVDARFVDAASPASPPSLDLLFLPLKSTACDLSVTEYFLNTFTITVIVFLNK